MKKNFELVYLLFSFVSLEVIFKLLNNISLLSISTIVTLASAIFVASVFALILNFFSKKLKIFLTSLLLFVTGFYFSVQCCIYSIYKFYFRFSSLSLLDQAAAFAGDGLLVIKNNIFDIFLMFLPFLIWVIVSKKMLSDKKENYRFSLISLLSSLIVFLTLMFLPITDGSLLSQTYKADNMIQVIDKLGVHNGFYYDFISIFLPKEEEIIVEEEVEEIVEEKVIHYAYNNLDIDFDLLNQATDNQSIQELNHYFSLKTGTLQNEYTSYFEGKNLILFMAESFNGIAVNKDLTPTLYKLIHEGFDFTNFYTPTVLSTIGGEYTELMSLYPEIDSMPNSLSIFRSDKNSYPMGIGNLFKEEGYATYAYHDSDYDFQDRNVYLNNLGFDSYNACGLGLETKINCGQWPKSDIEMIEATIDDYIQEDKFLVFYATVSGHGRYSFTEDSDISPKYESIVREYYGDSLGNDSASEMLLAYQAAQMELDRALETLIEKLQEAGKLEDTVIALVGDHHPYYLTDSLTIEEYNRLSTYERDEYIEIYHSNFILYNAAMESVEIDKVGSQLDVLPTLYNLFGLNYDSRLLMGTDLLSNAKSIAIMNDGSWVNDLGKYYAYNNTFVSNSGEELNESILTTYQNKVNNIKKISGMIMRNNYYAFVYENK